MPERPGPGFDRSTDDLFLAALDLDPAERTSFLDQACGGNQELRAEIESLLKIAEASPALLTPPEIGLIPENLGRYEIIAELGRGGMGIVFQARDSRLLRTVALKVLPRYLGQETRNLRRFTREAQLLARLNHPNIATLHSLDESDGFHFLTMEFVEGVTLAEILAGRALDQQETLSLALQVALALESAHAQGICHCDLKPANIMVSPEGKVSLLDFGIARAFGQLVAPPTPLEAGPAAFTLPAGTPGYMAPEQATGRPVDERSDLWAFGVILFECLTGEVFPGQAAAVTGGWAAKLPGKTPREMVALMRACLEPDPDMRLAAAAEARSVLERLLRRGAFRKRWLVGATAALGVAAALLWFLVLRGPQGPVVQLQNRDEQTLMATNAQGEALWTRQFDKYRARYPVVLRQVRVGEEPAAPRMVTGCAAIVDLTQYKSTLEFLSPEDGGTIWTALPEWTVPVNAHGSFQYSWLVAARWPGQESEILALGIRDGPWYGYALEFRDIGGNVLGTYHHSGILRPLASSLVGEVDYHGPIFFGSNSSARFDRALVPFATEQHVGCVVQLDPADVSGQSYPYAENLPEARDWPGMPRAREKAYLLIPPINDSTSSKVGEIVAGNPEAGGEVFTLFLADGRVVTLDENLYPIKSTVEIRSPLMQLMQDGQVQNLPYLYMQYGQKQWVDVPLGF